MCNEYDVGSSLPLQDVMKRQARKAGIIEELQKTEDKSPRMQQYDYIVTLNFPSLLQSIVFIVTYKAYSNETRFAWAYPETYMEYNERIPPGILKVVCVSPDA